MTNKEAIAILERKTTIPGDGYTWEQIEEAINVAVAALRAKQIGSEPLKYEQLRKMDGQVVRQVIQDDGKIYENLLLVNTYDKDCVWLFDAYFHSAPYHNDDEFKEEGFTIYPYNPLCTNHKPLTLDQLRKMDGKPVWVEDKCDPELSAWGNVCGNVCVVSHKQKYYGAYHIEDYEGRWLAYSYPPAHINRDAWTAEWEWFDEETGNPIDGIEREWGWKCSKCGNALPDDFDNQDYPPKIEFCPFCGRAMTPRAWAEPERKLIK